MKKCPVCKLSIDKEDHAACNTIAKFKCACSCERKFSLNELRENGHSPDDKIKCKRTKLKCEVCEKDVNATILTYNINNMDYIRCSASCGNCIKKMFIIKQLIIEEQSKELVNVCKTNPYLFVIRHLESKIKKNQIIFDEIQRAYDIMMRVNAIIYSLKRSTTKEIRHKIIILYLSTFTNIRLSNSYRHKYGNENFVFLTKPNKNLKSDLMSALKTRSRYRHMHEI
jgi:hypothetical protein